MPAEPSSSARVKETVERFTVAWQHGSPPLLDDYLPAESELRRAALVELARTDLQLRLQAGEPARAEDYLERFAELAADPAAAAVLVGAEYSLRRQAGTAPAPGEYLQRFPRYADLLAACLPTLAGAPAAGPTLPAPPPAGEPAPGPAAPGSSVEAGRYRALASHARGGLGEVLVALDTQLARRVALKRMQARWRHDPECRRRFLVEAEVTGRLEHPGVVPVYSLTQDSDGEPCYAMRFIEGQTLQEAIERYHAAPSVLGLRQLLARFVAVCNVIGYAHSRGILHRDLKPANIMIGKYGETLVVDWGLAKQSFTAVGAESAEKRLKGPSSASSAVRCSETLPGQVLGTPAYMSPEQAAGAWDRIGPAADVYALGATLYCLLTGRPPFVESDVHLLLAQVQLGEYLPPRSVQPDVPRPLEAICQKAMALVPAERYGNALELAADLERWLADEPVSAYREPLLGRAARWLRRHKAPAAAAAALLLTAVVALTAGVVLLSRANARTEEQRDRALAQEAKAQEAAARAEAVNNFLTDDLLAEAAPEKNPRTKQVTVEEVLDRAADKVDKGFAAQPLVEASVRLTLANTYWKLGQPVKGELHAQRALDLYQRSQGPDDPGTLEAVNELALVLEAQGKLAKAEDLYRQNVEARRRVQGAEHLNTLNAVNNLADLLRNEGKLTEAEPLFRQNLEACRRVLGPEHPETLAAVNSLALLLQDQGKLTEAEPLFRQALETGRRVQGPEHPNTLTAVNNLALLLWHVGKLTEAEPLFRQALEAGRHVQGPEHPDTLIGVNNLALLLWEQGKLTEAEPLFRQNLEARRRVLGADHPDTLSAVSNLAALLRDQAKLVEAEGLAREALARGRKSLPAGHPSLADSLVLLGSVLTAGGRAAEAEPFVREALERRRESLPTGHVKIAHAEGLLGACLMAQKKYAEAEPLLLAGYHGLENAPATTAAQRTKARQRLVELYEAWDKSAEAARWR
jgi:tRNA A-37 threonylcarbamoyl transferase component Bud32